MKNIIKRIPAVISFMCGIAVMLLFTQAAKAQNIPVGSWRTHLTYHNAQVLALADDRVYCASENGLFVFDRSTGSVEVISKISGLSDNRITALGYSDSRDVLFIGYGNGNIDLLYADGSIVNIRSVLNTANLENKRFNDVAFDGALAYAATGFGVVVLDLDRLTIAETYRNLGDEGAREEVLALTVNNDRLYIGGSLGLRSASLAPGVNRLDYRNWEAASLTGTGDVSAVTASGEGVVFAQNGQGIFRFNGSSSEVIESGNRTYFHLSNTGGQILLCADNGLFSVGSAALSAISEESILAPRRAFTSADGSTWIADSRAGLVQNSSGSFQNIYPSGTYNAASFAAEYFDNKMVVVSGGYDETYTPFGRTQGFYVFEEGRWTNYNSENLLPEAVSIPAVRDLCDVAYSSVSRKAYFASFNDGILIWDIENNSFSVLNSTNSILTNDRIISVEADSQGNIWAACYGVDNGQPVVFRISPEENLSPFTFGLTATQYPTELAVDELGNVWMALNPTFGGGIWIFNTSGLSARLTQTDNEGGLGSSFLFCLENDRDGAMWVGTDDGLKVFFDAGFVLQQSTPNASDVFFNRRILLNDERINAIATDGGNRKWFGSNGGVWLFEEDGSELFEQFTAENSPLLSNTILDIAVHAQTGEVFFATADGLVSFRGTATEGNAIHTNVKIFPNPVRPGFNGLITAEGLVRDAIVKVTDINGRLVFEDRAEGGTFTWDGRDYNGQQARTGIYLLFSSNRDGQEALVGKLAVVR